MASKRMFDKAIIDTDRFMDMQMSAKAIYFLLGMEADDEGFVSYKKVMRVHGGNEDDIKVLVAKQFLILFESGVVVITDWNKNNWLDSRRARPTEYQKEKKQLLLTENKEYVLSNRLESIEENRIEEKSIEEKVVQSTELPIWLNKKIWEEWIQYRKEKKQKLTSKSISLQLKLLSENIPRHAEIIETSIRNGWTGLFPVKNEPKKFVEPKQEKIGELRKIKGHIDPIRGVFVEE